MKNEEEEEVEDVALQAERVSDPRLGVLILMSTTKMAQLCYAQPLSLAPDSSDDDEVDDDDDESEEELEEDAAVPPVRRREAFGRAAALGREEAFGVAEAFGRFSSQAAQVAAPASFKSVQRGQLQATAALPTLL